MSLYKRTEKNSPWLNFTLWTSLTCILTLPMYFLLHWDNMRSISIAIVVSTLSVLWIVSLFVKSKQDSYNNRTGKHLKLNKFQLFVNKSRNGIAILLCIVILYLLTHADIL